MKKLGLRYMDLFLIHALKVAVLTQGGDLITTPGNPFRLSVLVLPRDQEKRLDGMVWVDC